MAWFRYRTIRSQLTIGFILLELLFTICFSLLILRTELREIHARAQRRIEQQVMLLATMATDAVVDKETHRLVPMAQSLEASTSVHFVRLTPEEISRYPATDEPHDKAGAYAIQGRAGRYIPRIEGDYFNVVGLPLAHVTQALAEFGWSEE